MNFALARHSLKAGKWLYRQQWRDGEVAVRADYEIAGNPDWDGFPTLYLAGISDDSFLVVDDYPKGTCEERSHRPSMAELIDDWLADDWAVCDPIT